MSDNYVLKGRPGINAGGYRGVAHRLKSLDVVEVEAPSFPCRLARTPLALHHQHVGNLPGRVLLQVAAANLSRPLRSMTATVATFALVTPFQHLASPSPPVL